MPEAAVIVFRPRSPNGTSPALRHFDARFTPLLAVALQGRSWEVTSAELNLQGHRRLNGLEWTAAAAKNAWTQHREPRHDVFRSEAGLLPVIEAGVAGYGWGDALAAFRQTARSVSPAGHPWTAQGLAAVFDEYATTQEQTARRNAVAARVGQGGAVIVDDPIRASVTYQILRTPGLQRPDVHIESGFDAFAAFTAPLFHVGYTGAGWGLTADILTSLELPPPEPFDIWCGLLTQRLWRSFACWGDLADRARNRRGSVAVSWQEALDAAAESEQAPG